MSRAPFQILVFPYKITVKKRIYYAVFGRSDSKNCWQGIAGGGKDNETPLSSAKREAFEEAGIGKNNKYLKLDSYSMLPVVNVCGFKWGPKVLVIPEYCFGVEIRKGRIRLSREHSGFKWVQYSSAMQMLKWDSNRNALWELNHRLKSKVGAV
ncbi:MAG: NUDIX pyrophosphatase [Elusimicrobia bacterium]|nr:NUDIX pyrophosphatase [Elusimicrobiota bacterium]